MKRASMHCLRGVMTEMSQRPGARRPDDKAN
jgi:hypothetical protein